MKIKNLIFPFTKHYSFLTEKWWHRFFTVAYAVAVCGFLIAAVFVSLEGVGEKTFNTTIKNTLRDFSKNSDKSIANTVPSFLEQGGKIGCFENNKIGYISTYTLENETFCSADISSHLDEATQKIIGGGSLTVERRKELLSEMLTKDTEKRYCFMPNVLNCSSDKVISYNRNVIYYLQVIIYSLFTTYLFSLFLQVLYFKGLIYIVYGKKSKAGIKD